MCGEGSTLCGSALHSVDSILTAKIESRTLCIQYTHTALCYTPSPFVCLILWARFTWIYLSTVGGHSYFIITLCFLQSPAFGLLSLLKKSISCLSYVSYKRESPHHRLPITMINLFAPLKTSSVSFAGSLTHWGAQKPLSSPCFSSLQQVLR